MSFDIQRIQKSTRRVRKFIRKNSRRPSSEAIHDLRTDLRRLETAFLTLGLDAKKNIKRMLRDLAEVRKCAGKVRDMDVLTADALTLKDEGEQDCLVQLLEYLGMKRGKYARKLNVVIETASPRLRRALDRASQRVEKLFNQADKDPLDSNALSATVAKAIELGADLASPARLTRTTLHPYRLKVKELRNVLQLAHQNGTQDFVRDLGEVKDAIGKWHDWEELNGTAAQILGHRSCQLRSYLTATSDSTYGNALRLSNRLRSKYLKGKKTVRGKRPVGTSMLSVPLLDATAAIAQH
jgi:CHAD domain-containing protein